MHNIRYQSSCNYKKLYRKCVTSGTNLLVTTTNKNSSRFNRCMMINITNYALHNKTTKTMGDAQTAERCHNILCIQENSGTSETTVSSQIEGYHIRKNSLRKWKIDTELWLFYGQKLLN